MLVSGDRGTMRCEVTYKVSQGLRASRSNSVSDCAVVSHFPPSLIHLVDFVSMWVGKYLH